MSEIAPVAPVAPVVTNKPALVKSEPVKPVEAKAPEVDDSEEYVVDGKTTRLNKEQRKLHFQKALAADKRIQAAAEETRKASELVKLFETDPEAALRKLNKDPDKLFASHLEKKAKLELMTQEQRDAESLRTRAEAAEAKAKKFEDEQKTAKQAETDARNFKALETQLIGAADKHGLSDTPETLEGLCDIALEFLEYGTTITADQVAQEFIRREKEHFEAKDKRLFSVLKGPKLLAYLGDATVAEIKAALSAADAESLKGIQPPKAKIKVAAHERAVRPRSGHISENSFDKKFGL